MLTDCVSCSVSQPRVGVAAVLCTHTHILEVCQGRVRRSCRLPSHLGLVCEVWMVESLSGEGWSYVVRGQGGGLVFVCGDSLVITGGHTHGQCQAGGLPWYRTETSVCHSGAGAGFTYRLGASDGYYWRYYSK